MEVRRESLQCLVCLRWQQACKQRPLVLRQALGPRVPPFIAAVHSGVILLQQEIALFCARSLHVGGTVEVRCGLAPNVPSQG